MCSVGKNNKQVKRQMLVEEKGCLSTLIDELLESIRTLASHHFTAKCQYKQYNAVTKDVQKNMVVTIADFSEKYRCFSQDEIQSAYYSYNQVTVYPMTA